nr:hypothetical protein [Tanacetum cinerariifolium]
MFVLFRRECDERVNEYVLAGVVRCVTQLGSVVKDCLLHSLVVKSGLGEDVYVGTLVVDFYCKVGRVEDARMVFDGLVVKNAVTWTTMIAGYARVGKSEISLELLSIMKESDVVLDRYVLSSALSACSILGFFEGGKQIHGFVLRRGASMDTSVSDALVDFYVKCGKKPDAFACTSALTSCASLEALEPGRQTHAYTIKTNLDKDEFVNNGLIDIHSKCSCLDDARRVFNAILNRNVIGYNAMIEGYSRLNNLYEALDLFREMRLKNIDLSLLTFVSLLGVSALLLSSKLSKQIHGFMVNALVDAYLECSSPSDDRLVFDEMREKDIVRPDKFTFVALITAASNLDSLPVGHQFHTQLLKIGLDLNPFVTNALLDMYSKCGSKQEAQNLFYSTVYKDIVCWNSMILTHAQHGDAKLSLKLFEKMLKVGTLPNYVTFVVVLSACDHMGLVKEGFDQFESMANFGIEPRLEHYVCIFSLLGQVGKLYEAKAFIEKLPIPPAAIIWRSLLSACRVAGNLEMGKYKAKKAIHNDPNDSGSYILLSNIYASKGIWGEAKKVRRGMEGNGVVKQTGCSWIEMDNEVYVFIAKDRSHRHAELIYSVIN